MLADNIKYCAILFIEKVMSYFSTDKIKLRVDHNNLNSVDIEDLINEVDSVYLQVLLSSSHLINQYTTAYRHFRELVERLNTQEKYNNKEMINTLLEINSQLEQKVSELTQENNILKLEKPLVPWKN